MVFVFGRLMFEMRQNFLQKAGPAKKGIEFSASREGRFTPAGLAKRTLMELFVRPAGVNRPSQLVLFAGASSACRLQGLLLFPAAQTSFQDLHQIDRCLFLALVIFQLHHIAGLRLFPLHQLE